MLEEIDHSIRTTLHSCITMKPASKSSLCTDDMFHAAFKRGLQEMLQQGK